MLKQYLSVLDLKSFGVIIIFCSWVTQNFIYAEYSAQKSEFITDVSFINNEMSVITPWVILFNKERLNEEIQPEIILNSAKRLLASMGSILQIAEKYHPSELVSKKITSDKVEIMLKDVATAQKEQNIDEILKIGMVANIAFLEVDSITRTIIQNKFKRISDSENYWKYVFLYLYIFGSIIVALGYIRERIANNHIKPLAGSLGQ